jgi:phage major head subunit gpT-like protein
MAVVTSDLLFLTVAGLKTEFDAAYMKAAETARWAQIATELPTTLPSQNYGWLGRGALMKQFYDEVEDQSVAGYQYTLADNVYKGNLTIQRKMLEDDQYALLVTRVRAMAAEPIRHWNQLAFEGLTSGFTSLCYDGQYFFDTDHSEGASGTQVNKVTTVLSDTALQTADATMQAYVDDKGIPMEIMPDTLVVGPANARKAWNLVKQDIVFTPVGTGTAGSGATASTDFRNYFNGRYNLIVDPYIRGTAAYYWFLLDTKKEIKPIIIQSRSDVPITLETDMDMPDAKIREKYRFSARGRYVQGYGLWQTAYGSAATS